MNTIRKSKLSCLVNAVLAFAFLVVGALLPAEMRAQGAATGTITGRVLNQGTGEYLRNATVSVVGTNISTKAEDGGNFSISGVPAGPQRLRVSYTGLESIEETVNVLAGQTVARDVNLTTTAYADGNTVKLGEFVVATEREGNAKAIQDQKSALNMKKVITTDVFGDIAEGNVGEFLKLMPGVTIDYVEADARTMSVRGLDPKYASITMDGMPVASAYSSNIGDGNSRAFEFEQISIASIETVEISKTPTPDVGANAVAGVVNLRGRGAFDRRGRQIRFTTSVGMNEYYTSLSKERYFNDESNYQPQLNAALSFSDVFLQNKLGVQAGVLISNALTAQKAIVTGYVFDNNPLNNETEVPRITNFNYRDGPKVSIRHNANVRLDYRFSANSWVYARADLNNYDATFHNRDLFISITNNANNVYNAGGTLADATIPYSRSTQTTNSGSVSVGSGGSNRKSGSTVTYATGFFHRRNAFQATGDFSVSIATNHYRDLPEGFFNAVGAAPTANFAFRWDKPSADSTAVNITQIGANNWRDESQWVISAATATNFPINSFQRDSRDRRATGKLDFRYSAIWKIPTQIKWGGSVLNQERYNKRDQSQFRFLGQGGGVQQTVSNAGFIDPVPMNFDMGGNIDGIRTTDRFALADIYNANPSWFVTNPPFALEQHLRNKIKLEERIDGLYVQTIFKFGSRFDLAPGVRWERTTLDTDSYRDIGRLAALRAVGLPSTTTDANARLLAHPGYLTARYGGRINNHTQYDDFFKYLHANFRVTPNALIRASYHEAITRPDPFRLVGQVVINNEEALPPTLSAGNPDLEPERSKNVNLSVEYYPTQAGVVSATWFRSDLDNLQVGFVEDLGPEGYDGDPAFAGWRLTSFTNGGKSHRTGIELDASQQLSFLPGFLKGFGVFANYTNIRYDKPETTLNRPSQLANGGFSYRQGRFNGNVRANWTGTRRNTNLVLSGANAGRREYTDDRLLIDLNFNVRLTKSLNLFANGRNVFNEPITTYVISTQNPLRVAKFGAAWTFGIEGRF